RRRPRGALRSPPRLPMQGAGAPRACPTVECGADPQRRRRAPRHCDCRRLRSGTRARRGAGARRRPVGGSADLPKCTPSDRARAPAEWSRLTRPAKTKTEETRMLNRIFPERIDNHYRGYKLALWVFVPIAFMKIAISLVHIFYRDGGAQSISTI